MKTKNNSKKIIISFQIFSVIFLVTGIIGKALLVNGYEIFILESTCLYFSYQICFSLFLLTEFIMIIALMIKNKKPLLLIANVVLLPILLLQLFATDFSLFTKSVIKTYNYENFDTDIVISNRSLLLCGESDVYEKVNKVLLRKIASVSGDDGYCPLEDESSFETIVDDSCVKYSYYFDGYTKSDNSKKELTLVYNNGHFTAKEIN